MQDLGTLPGGASSTAYGVSADGSVVVGYAVNASGQRRAFRWTAEGGMQDLGTLGGSWSVAYGVSADGSVVVGVAQTADGRQRAFRWTAEGGMQDLGTLGRLIEIEGYSSAYGVSADGSVVVGKSDHSSFRWTAQTGMQDLNVIYLHQYVTALWEARAISPNGRYIVGHGLNAATGRVEAFLLDTAAVLGAFRILNVTPGNGTLTIEWEARSGARYQLQAADAVSGPWVDVGPEIIASGPTASYTDNVSGVRQRFYRVLAR
jgi:probable HAF family extracellular repeat protein